MVSFLSELFRNSDRLNTVIVMDADQMEPPRQYQVRPRRLLAVVGGAVLTAAFLLVSLIVLTPLREFIPGYGTADIQQNARLNALRLASLQDSLLMQQQYVQQLRSLVTGKLDSAASAAAVRPEPALPLTGEPAQFASEAASKDWADHAQPALSVVQLPAADASAFRFTSAGQKYLSSLRFPVLPPVNGFFTRGFDARTGHFALDIAVDEGTMVRSIGDGYVILADWTQEGGYVVAVQHADGYVSVYKHNQQLLKRVGDRVRDREAVAVSGNSGEVTTGPHLHVEIWQHGLAQDPRHYFVG